MKLHGYHQSSAAFRVRIALNLKGLAWDSIPHHLRKGEQRSSDYLALNPQGLVPALELGDGTVLTQSLAIIEYLEETQPTPPLLPPGAANRARVRALAQICAVDIHPLNNLRVLKYLKGALEIDQGRIDAWYRHWVEEGFRGLEPLLAGDPRTGRYCHGVTPGLADICLVPQVVNGLRFGVDLAPFPTIGRIFETALAHPAFDSAYPTRQPDAE